MKPKLCLLFIMSLFGRALFADEGWDLAKIGDQPYSFSGRSITGEPVSVAALKGKVAVLYFFTTQPGAGMTELMLIQRDMWPQFHDRGLVIIGVGREAAEDELVNVAASLHIKFPLLPDPKKEIFLHYALRGHPRLYLLGRDGHIKLTSLGYCDDELDRINGAITRELKSPSLAGSP
jgi:peroxiredoxin